VVAYPNLSNPAKDLAPDQTITLAEGEILQTITASETILPATEPHKLSKLLIRSSLKASTWDAVFATIFGSITGGVLLSNFLLQLGATPVEIGMLSSMPMMVNLLQPLGAHLAERTTSRQWYDLAIFVPARLMWLILAIGIWWISLSHSDPHQLVYWALAIVLLSNVLVSLASASWLSWIAILVPVRLRGRYFGFRNSAASLTALIGVPLLGLAVSAWPGGTIQGYGALLCVGVVVGLISIGCQLFMADVNPQEQGRGEDNLQKETGTVVEAKPRLEPNFLRFLLYISFWVFAVNVGSPFFNLFLLDNLDIDVSWVTIYGSIGAAANLLMMVVWGKLADRIGNRPLMVLVGVLVALTPLLWVAIGADAVSLWVWFPLLHLLMGGTQAAIDLCTNNLQMDVAPLRNQSKYFAIAAAVAGVSGALGTTVGGFLASVPSFGGLPAVFALSAVVRLVALLPLVAVRENRSQPLRMVMRSLLPVKAQLVPVVVIQPADRSK
jgi:MFS family permease